MDTPKQFKSILAFFLLILALGSWNAVTRAQAVGGEDGPLLTLSDSQLSSSPVIISYGDMRFTDPKETTVTNPKVRRWLVEKIAAEKPDALLLSGDIPMHGAVADDYAVFQAETSPWRAAHLSVFPALGNHELNGKDQQQCLENWWNAFPQLRPRRWYSVQIGSKVFALNIDSNAPLLPGSDQSQWIEKQIAHLPSSVRFVFINMHYPPVADTREQPREDDSPRPNEIAFAELLKKVAPGKQARFIVSAAHVHNYERFLQDNVVYMVSGGGGAPPGEIKRGPQDLYQRDNGLVPNYHYVKFVLRENRLDAEMIRVSEPSADAPAWEVKDRFQIK